MTTFPCQCGKHGEVPDSRAGPLTGCPACRSALLVRPPTRTITRSRTREVGVWLATLLLWTCVGVVAGSLCWVLLLLDGNGLRKPSPVEVEEALPTLHALMGFGGMAGGFVGMLFGLSLMVPDEPPTQRPGLPHRVRVRQWPANARGRAAGVALGRALDAWLRQVRKGR